MRMRCRSVLVAVTLGWVTLVVGCSLESDLTPAQKLDRGWEAMRTSNISTARLMFEDAMASTRDDPAAHAQALYAMAASLSLPQTSPDLVLARKFLEQAIQIDPGDQTKPWAMLMRARLGDLRNVTVDDLDKLVDPAARDLYREVIARYPDHFAGDEARAYLIASLVVSGEKPLLEEAIALADQMVASRSDSPWASYILQMKSFGLRGLGRYQERLQVEIDALALAEKNNKVGTTEFAGTMWNIAIIAEFEVGAFDVARHYLNRIISEYPTDQRVFSAKYSLSRLDQVEAELLAELDAETAGEASLQTPDRMVPEGRISVQTTARGAE